MRESAGEGIRSYTFRISSIPLECTFLRDFDEIAMFQPSSRDKIGI
jgi:hypothetical protein